MCKLSILVPTYNKEEYIEECLDSIFMQRTNYSYQVIIADDCSTDNTLNIIAEYQKQHPNIIVLTSPKNQKLYKNILRAYEITKTDYFTVLDPDDYWIDKYKIQKALNFLEQNPEYTLHISNSYQKLRDGSIVPFSAFEEVDSVFQNYLYGNPAFAHTSGTIFRNVIFKHGIPEKMLHLPNPTCEVSFRGDSFRNVIHLHEGKARTVAHYESVYRITDTGIWQKMTEFEQDLTNTQAFLNFWLYFDKKYPEIVLRALLHYKKTEVSLQKLDKDSLPQEKFMRLLQQFKQLRELLTPLLDTIAK